jgi:hypothetical protein
MSSVNPAQATFGSSLFMLEKKLDFSQHWYRRNKAKQQVSCCLFCSHCLVKGIYCRRTTSTMHQHWLNTEINENWLFWERRTTNSEKENKLKKGETIAQHSVQCLCRNGGMKKVMNSTYHGDEIRKVKTKRKEEIRCFSSRLQSRHDGWRSKRSAHSNLLRGKEESEKIVFFPSVSRILRLASSKQIRCTAGLN